MQKPIIVCPTTVAKINAASGDLFRAKCCGQ